jgi:uncharacterized iron-regulated membrane protein
MEQTAINWTVFGWTLASALIFGILFAGLVRWASKRKIVGQTAWAVVVGVSVTLIMMIPVFGLNLIAIAFCYFGATGLPMIVEYLLRIQKEIEQDSEKAQGLAKDLLK